MLGVELFCKRDSREQRENFQSKGTLATDRKRTREKVAWVREDMRETCRFVSVVRGALLEVKDEHRTNATDWFLRAKPGVGIVWHPSHASAEEPEIRTTHEE
jgi:hypothetical protein